MVDSVSVRFKNARVEKMPLNIRIQWNAGTACVSECVLKTLACRGLRVGPSKCRVMLNRCVRAHYDRPSVAIPPACYRSPSGPSKSPPECPRECPRKWGVSEGVSDGVSKKCPQSVKKVSRTLWGHSRDSFLDTPEPGALRAPGTPRRTLPRTPPIFGDTLGDTPGTLRARRARETPVAGRRDRKPSGKSLRHEKCMFVPFSEYNR